MRRNLHQICICVKPASTYPTTNNPWLFFKLGSKSSLSALDICWNFANNRDSTAEQQAEGTQVLWISTSNTVDRNWSMEVGVCHFMTSSSFWFKVIGLFFFCIIWAVGYSLGRKIQKTLYVGHVTQFVSPLSVFCVYFIYLFPSASQYIIVTAFSHLSWAAVVCIVYRIGWR